MPSENEVRVRHGSEKKTIDRSRREQSRFLDYCITQQIELTIFTFSGSQFLGLIYDFDDHSVLFGGRNPKSKKRLIRKSFISLIIPNEPIQLFSKNAGVKVRREALPR